MNRLYAASVLALSFAASAQQGGSAASNEGAAPGTALEQQADRHCLSSTGSRIAPRKGECSANAGRSYSGDELRSTGATNAGDALRMLDPSVTVQH